MHGAQNVDGPVESAFHLDDQAHPIIPVSLDHQPKATLGFKILFKVQDSMHPQSDADDDAFHSLGGIQRGKHQWKEIRFAFWRGLQTPEQTRGGCEAFATGQGSKMQTTARMAILDEAEERIRVLQQLKLFEMEAITPNLANRRISQTSDFASRGSEKLLVPHTYNPKLGDKFIEPPGEKEVRQYWFYTIDFLLDNNFITEQDVRKEFQEERIAEQTVMYCFYNISFKVLGFKEKRIIDFSFLVKKLRIFGARFNHSVYPIQELDQFLEAFQIEKYLKNLDYLISLKILGCARESGLSLTISEILNFIENELYAGLVKEAASELLGDEEKVKQVEDKAQLILNYFEFEKIRALPMPAAYGPIDLPCKTKTRSCKTFLRF
ncbi:hypothetical protein KEM48_012521 [Puccinia striiformis f. sp. tritici PST-130]|nr:hypothetical protein KEM48_012521 [Puccinia striiformis f. sp. tritici PST-130]